MKKISALITASGALLVFAAPAFAAYSTITTVSACPFVGSGFENLCQLQFDGTTIRSIITIAFMVATLIALAFLIWGGIRWILSGGEKEKVEEARGTIVAALVGLVIVFLAYFILAFVFKFIGINFITDFKIPSLHQ